MRGILNSFRNNWIWINSSFWFFLTLEIFYAFRLFLAGIGLLHEKARRGKIGKEREKKLKKTLALQGCLEVSLSREKYLYFNIFGIIMTLDDFFRECERKGVIPLSYRSHSEFVNGSRTVEYKNPMYAKAKARLAEMLGMKQTGDPRTDNLLNRLYGEDIVIRTKDGYHFGRLQGYDGKGFLLGNYLFGRKPMDIFDYSSEFFLGEDTIIPIPAEGIISISKIPIMTEEFA